MGDLSYIALLFISVWLATIKFCFLLSPVGLYGRKNREAMHV